MNITATVPHLAIGDKFFRGENSVDLRVSIGEILLMPINGRIENPTLIVTPRKSPRSIAGTDIDWTMVNGKNSVKSMGRYA